MAFIHCEIKSECLKMPTNLQLILPHDYPECPKEIKTLYLLHGRSHNYSMWARNTLIERFAEKYKVAVIMPEANRSFYTNMKYGVRYLDYITKELPYLCEKMFRISNNANNRYIAGMSMGGYGSLKAALTRPSYYAGCAALSSVTDIKKRVETEESSGSKDEFCGIFGSELAISEEDDLFYLAKRNANNKEKPVFYLACGTEDPRQPDNIRFKDHLESLSYSIDYNEWTGIHDWKFWNEAVEKLMYYFFDEKK